MNALDRIKAQMDKKANNEVLGETLENTTVNNNDYDYDTDNVIVVKGSVGKNNKANDNEEKEYAPKDNTGVSKSGETVNVLNHEITKFFVFPKDEKKIDENQLSIYEKTYTTTHPVNRFLVKIQKIESKIPQAKRISELTDEEKEVTYLTLLVTNVIKGDRVVVGEEIVVNFNDFTNKFHIAKDDYCGCCYKPISEKDEISYLKRASELPSMPGLEEEQEWMNNVIKEYDGKLCQGCQRKQFTSNNSFKFPLYSKDGVPHESIENISKLLFNLARSTKENKQLYKCTNSNCNNLVGLETIKHIEALIPEEEAHKRASEGVLCYVCASKKYNLKDCTENIVKDEKMENIMKLLYKGKDYTEAHKENRAAIRKRIINTTKKSK